jgi:hypothetical protein
MVRGRLPLTRFLGDETINEQDKNQSSIGTPIIAPIILPAKMRPRNPTRIAAMRIPALK